MAVDTNLITALGAGSGVDVKALANSLVEAERAPKQQAIQSKIDKSEAKISGYSAMMAALDIFKQQVDGFDSVTDFAAVDIRNSNPLAVQVSTNSLASPGAHTISITSLAQAQRSVGDGFNNVTAQVNGGDAFDITLTVGSGSDQSVTTVSISAANTNASAVVNAINQAGAGVSAQLLDTGVEGAADRYKIVLAGQTGASNSFTVTTNAADSSGLNFTTPAGQNAADASVTVNGVAISRETNTIDDVIPGMTFELLGPTTGAVAVQLNRDSSGVKERVQSLVAAYNNMVTDFGILTGPASDDEEDIYSGSLRGDSTVRSVLSQIRQVFFGESQTKGDSIASLRDMGVSVDKDGVVTLDEATLDEALANNFEEVVSALAGRTSAEVDGETVIRQGLGAEMASRLRALMGPSGLILSQSSSAENQVTRYEEQLETLETRMEGILERYTKQFAAMESIVGQLTSMRENLKSQFEAMLNTGKN
jgi:flagellar hook-associated protein 2